MVLSIYKIRCGFCCQLNLILLLLWFGQIIVKAGSTCQLCFCINFKSLALQIVNWYTKGQAVHMLTFWQDSPASQVNVTITALDPNVQLLQKLRDLFQSRIKSCEFFFKKNTINSSLFHILELKLRYAPLFFKKIRQPK